MSHATTIGCDVERSGDDEHPTTPRSGRRRRSCSARRPRCHLPVQNTLVIWTTDHGAWVDAWPDAGYTPFRGEKGSAFEGGFRVPAIAWWPGTIEAGTVATEMMSHMDWWPTFAGLIGVEPPPHIWQDNNGKPIVFDGLDCSKYLLGQGPSARHVLLLLR